MSKKKNAALPQNQHFLKRKEKKLVKKLFDFQLKKKKNERALTLGKQQLQPYSYSVVIYLEVPSL
jgi:hypothetical protein